MSQTRQSNRRNRDTLIPMYEDFDRCYRAVQSKDARFDGWFVTAVKTTGIYCRPSCPVRPPMAKNMSFYPSAAAAQHAGFRACKRCSPDASPGSPEWNLRADTVARAMRLIGDGIVDREGVSGLAGRLGYSSRQIERHLLAEVGAGPLALARAQRAQTARLLIEKTALPFSDVAFAAGFSSIRQFNDTVRLVFDRTPTDLRRLAETTARSSRPPRPVSAGSAGSVRSTGSSRSVGSGSASSTSSTASVAATSAVSSATAVPSASGALALRLPFRKPFCPDNLFGHLAATGVPGCEEHRDGAYRRTMRLPRGNGIVSLTPTADHVACQLDLDDLRDVPTAISRCRRLLDLDADPEAIDEALAADPALGPLVLKSPGRRVPRTIDEAEFAVRAVIGQQVSTAAARTHAARLVAAHGTPITDPGGGLTHVFPSIEELTEIDPTALAVPATRQRCFAALVAALADGAVDLGAGSDWDRARHQLAELPGIGPWTIEMIAMRALGDPDAFPVSDLGVRRAAADAGIAAASSALTRHAERWRPWRAYAVQYLWATTDHPINHWPPEVRP
jgi:AraC family transcriptional regulator, regulatory protein of adaptative response / DNA-3-methyladenine glycosylase II